MDARRAAPRAALFALGLGLAASAIFTLGSQKVDPDLFWHLRVAELIAADGPRPISDSFSYNSLDQPWLPYSWLAELGMRRAVDAMGGWALYLVPLLCYLGTLVFVALAMVARAGPSLKSGIVSFLAAALILPFIGLRPASFAFPICAYAAWALTGTRGRQRWAAAAALIPLTALLANLHLFFLFPPLALLAWAVGTAGAGARAGAGAAVSAGSRSGRWREALAYAGIAVLALAAALLANPFGFRLVEVGAHYVLDDVMVRRGVILEMLPFYRLGPLVSVGTLLLVGWVAAGLVIDFRRFDRRDLALLILALALLLGHGRYVPLAVPLLAPLAASHAPWPALATRPAALARALTAGLVLGLSIAAAQRLLRESPDLDWHRRAGSTYPVAAARYVRDSLPRTSGRLINEMGWGGYLIYALWPDYQVMLDGRTQVYDASLWRAAYVDATAESRLQLFRDARADAAILPIGSEWAASLGEMGWRLVYQDSVAAVWAP